MTWNHRIVRRVWYRGEDREEITYGIHEAYYDDNNLVHSITEKPVEVMGEDMNAIKQTLEWMTKALENPILDYNNIPEPGAKDFTIEIDEALAAADEEPKADETL